MARGLGSLLVRLAHFAIRPATFLQVRPVLRFSTSNEAPILIRDKLKKLQESYRTGLLSLFNEAAKNPAGSADSITELFETLKQLKLANKDITSKMLWVLCHERRLDQAFQLFQESSASGLVNSDAYTTLIWGYSRAGNLTAANEVFSMMKSAGIAPNPQTYKVLLQAHIAAGSLRPALDLLPPVLTDKSLIKPPMLFELLSACLEAGNYPAACTVLGVAQKFEKQQFYRLVIKLLDHWHQEHPVEPFTHIIRMLFKSNVKLDIKVMNVMLSRLSVRGQMAGAEEVFDAMMRNDISPTVHTYGSLIHGYCRAGEMTSAVKVWNRMIDAKVPPNETVYMLLIHGYCRALKLEPAEHLLEQMNRTGVPATKQIYSLFVTASKKLKDSTRLAKYQSLAETARSSLRAMEDELALESEAHSEEKSSEEKSSE
eukprot:TRINITY_DN1657_c0_g2_i1.p1 TRINITY_DN1657_c0_g2~~TRINITY_DN1657_c0_g2_i1.p1  ORF type:complete len:428 (-),score=29.83 TRINITY_DN1657_c0_g2_i1:31-1314(-)